MELTYEKTAPNPTKTNTLGEFAAKFVGKEFF